MTITSKDEKCFMSIVTSTDMKPYVFYNEISQIGSVLACLSDFVIGYVGVAVNEFIKKYFS